MRKAPVRQEMIGTTFIFHAEFVFVLRMTLRGDRVNGIPSAG
jgi:hypothetical protein